MSKERAETVFREQKPVKLEENIRDRLLLEILNERMMKTINS